MTEADLTLDKLPEHIIEEIFSYIPEKADLELVCHAFKDVINNSTTLLKDKWLVIDRVGDFDSTNLHRHYQKMKIKCLSIEVMDWMSDYQHKDRIKEMHIEHFKEREEVTNGILVQYILSNFHKLRSISLEEFSLFNYPNVAAKEFKLKPNKHSKLETLCIDRDKIILEWFSKIPTIKTISIDGIRLETFLTETNWQLEQLKILSCAYYDQEIGEQFLLSQKFSLKKLILDDRNHGYVNFIMRNLPSLEHLMINLDDSLDCSNEEFYDYLLLKNNKLKRLDIQIWDEASVSFAANAVLNLYNGIKFLSIFTRGAVPALDIQYDNLTHLMLNGFKSFPFLNSKFLNIKVLVLIIGYIKYDFSTLIAQPSNESIKNVEKLSIKFSREINDVLTLLPKFPQLIQLNLDTYYRDNKFISTINEIITASSTIKCIGITKKILSDLKISIEMLSTQISIKDVKFKLYKDFKSMVAEEWGEY